MEVSIHEVAEIRVEANSAILPGGEPHYWQVLVMLSKDGRDMGRVTLHLDEPAVALPVGDQPPYWGIDLAKPPALVDGKAPF